MSSSERGEHPYAERLRGLEDRIGRERPVRVLLGRAERQDEPVAVLEVGRELQPVEVRYARSRSVRLRSASALISAPRSSAIPVIQSQVSITITPESAPHVLLYDANVAV